MVKMAGTCLDDKLTQCQVQHDDIQGRLDCTHKCVRQEDNTIVNAINSFHEVFVNS